MATENDSPSALFNDLDGNSETDITDESVDDSGGPHPSSPRFRTHVAGWCGRFVLGAAFIMIIMAASRTMTRRRMAAPAENNLHVRARVPVAFNTPPDPANGSSGSGVAENNLHVGARVPVAFNTPPGPANGSSGSGSSGNGSIVPRSSVSPIPLQVAACTHPNPRFPRHDENGALWLTLKAFVKAMQSIHAPVFIHAGTVLGLGRQCTVFGDDVDFGLEFEWYKEHYHEIEQALVASHFRPKWFFPGASAFSPGSIPASAVSTVGFETGWTSLWGVKVDLFSVSWSDGFYTWGLWTAPRAGIYNKCKVKATATAPFRWHGVDVQVPMPLDDVLTSLYGGRYIKPQGWTWDREPFTVGSCVHATRRRSLGMIIVPFPMLEAPNTL